MATGCVTNFTSCLLRPSLPNPNASPDDPRANVLRMTCETCRAVWTGDWQMVDGKLRPVLVLGRENARA